jgi:hypothetical protein
MTTVVREPLLKTVAILDLRPTQMTVGMREVKAAASQRRPAALRYLQAWPALQN